MKTIGFIDYYLSEWHANNYPKWFAEINEKEGFDYKIAYAYADLDVSPLDNVTSKEWCEKNGASLCSSIEEVCAKSDYLVILAPSNPETHLSFCQRVFPNFKGGYIYIDKTFAPNLEIAKEIFALAKENDIHFFSSSALRYNSSLNLENVKSFSAIYWGDSIEEYVIHAIESVVKVMKENPIRLKAEKGDTSVVFEIAFNNGKSAFIDVNDSNADKIIVEYLNGEKVELALAGDSFTGLAKAILTFFESGKVDFDTQETLDVMAIRDKILIAQNAIGERIDL